MVWNCRTVDDFFWKISSNFCQMNLNYAPMNNFRWWSILLTSIILKWNEVCKNKWRSTFFHNSSYLNILLLQKKIKFIFYSILVQMKSWKLPMYSKSILCTTKKWRSILFWWFLHLCAVLHILMSFRVQSLGSTMLEILLLIFTVPLKSVAQINMCLTNPKVIDIFFLF